MGMDTTIEQQLADWMRQAFQRAFPEAGDALASVSVSPTTSAEFGEYQCNQAMALGKLMKKAPRQIAQAAVAWRRRRSPAPGSSTFT